MATAIEINSAYIENLTAILTGDLDSVTPDFTSMNRTLPDTLAEATEVEKEFYPPVGRTGTLQPPRAHTSCR